MENIQQPKKSNLLKVISIVLLALVGLVLLSIALFYFMPIPEVVKVKHGGEIQRCLYMAGIGYYTPIVGADAFNRLYDSNGNVICNHGGYGGKPAEGPCKSKMCFSVYDN